jgi:hypothetical protein
MSREATRRHIVADGTGGMEALAEVDDPAGRRARQPWQRRW